MAYLIQRPRYLRPDCGGNGVPHILIFGSTVRYLTDAMASPLLAGAVDEDSIDEVDELAGRLDPGIHQGGAYRKLRVDVASPIGYSDRSAAIAACAAEDRRLAH